MLEGYVESPDKEKSLLTHAKKLFGDHNVTNHLKIAAGAPEDWEYISTFALERLKDVDYGDMKLSNHSYEFTAHLPSPSSKAAFLDGIRTVMSNPDNKYGKYRGDYIITAPVEEVAKKRDIDKVQSKTASSTQMTAAACQKKIAEILGERKILFDYNKASIKKDSYTLLNSVISGLKTCKVTHLEIAGYTDNIGQKAYNKRLSEKRAQAVKSYFIKKGLDAKTLHTKGYGEAKPVASNKTKEGRAKNRRIEFIIKGVTK